MLSSRVEVMKIIFSKHMPKRDIQTFFTFINYCMLTFRKEMLTLCHLVIHITKFRMPFPSYIDKTHMGIG